MGHLQNDAGTVAGIGFATAGAAMAEINENGEGLTHDLVRFFPFDVDHETDSARVVFELRVIQALLGRQTKVLRASRVLRSIDSLHLLNGRMYGHSEIISNHFYKISCALKRLR